MVVGSLRFVTVLEHPPPVACLPLMGLYWKNLRELLRSVLGHIWAYLGTLAAMSLMLGALGMGIYHIAMGGESAENVECFRGVFNSAGAELPRGSHPLPGRPAAAMGCPHLRFIYGEGGRLERLVHVDAQGRPSPMPGSKVVEQRLDYDAQGRLIRKSNLDARGRPAPDASGVPVREYGYDEAGRVVSTRFTDGLGKGLVPRMPGYATALTRYDSKGRPLRIDYLDGQGEPIVNAGGECSVEFVYDDARRSSTRSNRVRGELVDNAQGYAVEHRQMAEDGRSLILRWEDAQGRPVMNAGTSAASLLREYDAAGNIRRERLCGEAGGMVQGGRSCAEHLVRRNGDGSMTWECYNAADGQPCMNPLHGFAERVTEYGPGAVLLRECFWDERGKPTPCYEKHYHASADEPSVISLHTDGSTELRPQ